MNIFLILLYVVMVYMIFRMLAMRKVSKKMSKLIDLVKVLEDKEAFMMMADEDIETAATDEEKTKFQILKLWGLCYHKEYPQYETLLEEINPSILFASKSTNDDSFFYLLLAIPNILQADGRWEELKKLEEKTENNREEYEKRLDYQVAVNCLKYYRNEDDRGFAFFESVMEGNYGEYFYNRQLIGLYKETVATMLIKPYEEKGDMEHYDEMKSICEQYQQTRIGDMWLKNMGIILGDYPPSEYEERIPESHEENKNEDVIEAETEEHKEETIEDLVDNTESGTSFVSDEENHE